MSKKSLASLFFFLLALNLIIYSPRFHSSDGQAMFATAESLVRLGEWHIEQLRWMGLQQGTFGLDGLLYSRKGLGQPLLALPLTALGFFWPTFGPATTTLLFGSIVAALTAVLLALFLARLGYSQRVALLTGLAYGSATMAWPYAKTFFSDPLAGFLLLLTAFCLHELNRTDRLGYAFLAGLSIAFAVATRYAEAVFLPVFGLLLLAYRLPAPPKLKLGPVFQHYRRHLLRKWQSIAAFCAPIAVVGFSLLGFNLSRYGDPFSTGYLPQESFSAVWWQGIFGQLFSPGRGIFWYNPILFAASLGLLTFWKRHRLETLALAAIILIHLLLYGKWFMWHGGFAWGPRFMMPALPAWLILLAPVLERTLAHARQWPKIGLGLLWGVSVVVQIPGWAVDFALWQNRLLDTGLPLFAPITFLDPTYSPLLGTWSLLTADRLTVIWMQNSQPVWPLLLLLGGTLILTGWAWSRQRPEWSAGMVLATTVILLAYAPHAHPSELQTASAVINQFSAPLIYHSPPAATALSDLIAHRAPLYGLAKAEPERLAAITAEADSLWLLTEYQPDLEAALLAEYGLARQESFGPYTLRLLARPDGPTQPNETRFGTAIQLQTAQVSVNIADHSPLAVNLIWQSEEPLTTTYHIFLHLVDDGGQLIAQSDGQPANWSRPTPTWLPGERIFDPHALWLPDDLPPGRYTLRLGLYEPQSGQRLLTKSGAEWVSLGVWEE